MAGRLRLKGRDILEMGRGAKNAHQLSLRSGRSYPPLKRYIEDPEDIQSIDLGVLTDVLTKGQGLTVEELLDLRIRDLFEYVSEPD